jgi:hypothetical protein
MLHGNAVTGSMAIVARLNTRASALRARVAAMSARFGPLEVAIALGAALAAIAGTIGADARWLAALGRIIVDRGEIPDGIPYASAPSTGWHNVPVLAELILRGLTSVPGDRGLLLAQVVAVAAALAILAWDLRREGADDFGGALVLLVVVAGALPVLVIVRSQLFSLLLFPVLIALLRADARSPSPSVWVLPPLFALWSNLHGAVLVGLAVAATYLVFGRGRRQPLLAVSVLVASALAVCITPALEQTPEYYRNVLGNEAARHGEGLWAPLSLASGFDLLLVAAAVVLLVLVVRDRPALWEAIALAGLAVLTVKTARSGVWLLFFAAAPAARGLRLEPDREWKVARIALPIAFVLMVFGLVRGPLSSGSSRALLDVTLRRAHGTPILADGVPGEQVALAGGRVWMSNPLDAFSHRDQRLYLDWLAGRPAGDAALRYSNAVLVIRGGSAAKRLRDSRSFRESARDANAILYLRRR